MASNETTVTFILDQIKGAGNVSAKKMFGEYAIYCNQKVVALVCDNMFSLRMLIEQKRALAKIYLNSSMFSLKKYLWKID